MILLSALLASLTGFVAGERPASQRVRVELSAMATAVEAEAAAVPQPVGATRARAHPMRAADDRVPAPRRASVSGARAHLDLKQSWLI